MVARLEPLPSDSYATLPIPLTFFGFPGKTFSSCMFSCQIGLFVFVKVVTVSASAADVLPGEPQLASDMEPAEPGRVVPLHEAVTPSEPVCLLDTSLQASSEPSRAGLVAGTANARASRARPSCAREAMPSFR